MRAWDDILLPLYFTDGGLDIRQTLAAGDEPMLPSAKELLDDPRIKQQSIHDVWKVRFITLSSVYCHKRFISHQH